MDWTSRSIRNWQFGNGAFSLAPAIPMPALPRSPESMERRRRRGMSFLQLHIPEASAWVAAIGTPTSEGSFSARYHAHYPSLPSFTFTAPIGEEAPSSDTPSSGGIGENFLLGTGRKFHFGGLRRISQTVKADAFLV